jgi:hypothetical protein
MICPISKRFPLIWTRVSEVLSSDIDCQLSVAKTLPEYRRQKIKQHMQMPQTTAMVMENARKRPPAFGSRYNDGIQSPGEQLNRDNPRRIRHAV